MGKRVIIKFFIRVGRACKKAGCVLVLLITFGRINWVQVKKEQKKKKSSTKQIPVSPQAQQSSGKDETIPSSAVSPQAQQSSDKDEALSSPAVSPQAQQSSNRDEVLSSPAASPQAQQSSDRDNALPSLPVSPNLEIEQITSSSDRGQDRFASPLKKRLSLSDDAILFFRPQQNINKKNSGNVDSGNQDKNDRQEQKNSDKYGISPLLQGFKPEFKIKDSYAPPTDSSDSNGSFMGLPLLLNDIPKTTPSELSKLCSMLDALCRDAENINLMPEQQMKLNDGVDKKIDNVNEAIDNIKTQIDKLSTEKKSLSDILKKIHLSEEVLIKQIITVQVLIQTLKKFFNDYLGNGLEKKVNLKNKIGKFAKEFDELNRIHNEINSNYCESINILISLENISHEKIQELQDIENELTRNKISEMKKYSFLGIDRISQKNQLIIKQKNKIRKIVDDYMAQAMENIKNSNEYNNKLAGQITSIFHYTVLIKQLEKEGFQDDLDTIAEWVESSKLLDKTYRNSDSLEKKSRLRIIVHEKIQAINTRKNKPCLKKERSDFVKSIIEYFKCAFPEKDGFQRVKVDKKELEVIIKEAARLRQSISNYENYKDSIVDQDDVTFKEYLDSFINAVNDKNTPRLSSLFCPFTYFEYEMRKILFIFLDKKEILASLGKKHPAMVHGYDSSLETTHTSPNIRKKSLVQKHNSLLTSSNSPSRDVYNLSGHLSKDLSSSGSNFSLYSEEERKTLAQLKQFDDVFIPKV